jgi:plastocyanin
VINHRIRHAALALGLVTAALTGCSSSSDGAGPTSSSAPTDGVEVNTALLAFDPMEARIKTGQTVTWVGGDNIKHVLVEGTYEVGGDKLRTSQTDDKAFNLELTKKGQKVSHTYDKAGTFTYYCTIHHGMNGSVVVS